MHNWRRLGYASSILLGLIVMAILCPISFRSATPAEATDKPANPATLTFTSTSSTASVSLSVTSTSGNSAASSSNASFTLKTDNATGYTLNLKTSGSDTTLSDGTNTISSITSTSGTTLANLPVNTWGLLPNKYNGADNTTNYYPASSTGFTMDETSAANTTANPYTIGIGIKVNYDTPAGTYTNTTLVAEYVANAVTYSINYYTNTTDTVTNMPTINPQSGTVSQGTTSTSVALASAPTRTGYTFVGWCLGSNASTSNIAVKTDGNPDVCSTTTYTAGQQFGIDATVSPDTYYLFAMWQRNSYTCTKQYRLENADGTWGSYQADGTEQVLYGETCSYSKSVTNYKNSASGTNNSTASTSGTMGTDGLTLQLSLYRNTFTCSKRYRLQGADGNYPSTYTDVTGETIKYGATCSYSQSYTDYQTQSTSQTITSAATLSLDLPRNTYTLTVTASTNTSSATGGGTYRWGQTVTVGVTKVTDVTCTTYATPTWTATAGTAPSAGASTTFTMPKSNVTVTATSSASNVAQTITLNRSNATNITIAGTAYGTSTTSVSLNCGNYSITGTFPSGYEFSSWSRANGVAVTSTSTLSTTMTVTGAGTLTLTGKSSKTYMQNLTSSTIATLLPSVGNTATVYDSRDEQAYTIAKLADNKYWMVSNLNLAGGTAISCTTSDCENYTIPTTQGWQSGGKLPASSTSGFSSDNYAYVYNSGSTTCGSNSPCYSYYSWDAATLGSGRSISTDNTNAPYSICPKGWKLPTTYNGTNSTTDFRALMIALGGSSSVQTYNSSTSPTGATMYGKLTASPYNFLLAGSYYGSSFFSGGSSGFYWSATSYSSSTRARYLNFNSTYVDSAFYGSRRFGFSVRCVFGG